MSKPTEFEVLREHLGDKPYKAGDTRTMPAGDAANLIKQGVLVEKADKPLANKAEPAPINKAAPAPINKAAPKPVYKRT